VASRTVCDGVGSGYQNEYWTAFGLLDRFQFQTRCVREKCLHMARGRGHFPLTYRTFRPFYGLGPLSRSNLHGKCGRAQMELTEAHAAFCILIRRNASSHHDLRAGAECSNSAHTDLCGGRSEMAVPVATVHGLRLTSLEVWLPSFRQGYR